MEEDELEQKVAKLNKLNQVIESANPGWLALWNLVEDDKIDRCR